MQQVVDYNTNNKGIKRNIGLAFNKIVKYPLRAVYRNSSKDNNIEIEFFDSKNINN